LGKGVWKTFNYKNATPLPRGSILRFVKETKKSLEKKDFALIASGDTLVVGYREKDGRASVFVAKVLREYERR